MKKLVCSIFCFVILVSTATTYQTKAEWTGFYTGCRRDDQCPGVHRQYEWN